jgi:hypothetical protein
MTISPRPLSHAVALVACVLMMLVSAGYAAAGELGVNVYGLSYHFDREEAKERGLDNEVNPGLGLRYRMPRQEFDWFVDGGAHRDSARNTAVYAGGGAFWKPTQRWRLGGALALFQSDTYNDGDPFIAPVPLVAYEWRPATITMAYFPRIGGVNEVHTLGFWLTLWPSAF